MWILTPLQTEGETHYLLTSKEYLVGRKNCDILLPYDQSISRTHAHLTATDQTLILKDTSKYGIFVNSQRVTGNMSVNLKSGDIVTFGVFHSKFTVNHQKLVVCSSCLDSDCKASLSQTLLALGGKLVNTWTEDCTHLTMPSVKVTVKTISALLCCCPIVKPEFFSELDKAVQQKLPPPKAESFVPEIDEPSLSKEDINLQAMPVRKQLFTEKTFVFLSAKQFKRLSVAVGFGGGRSQLLKEGSLPHDLLESPHSCVIDVTTSSSQTVFSPSLTEWAISVKNIVQRKGFRVITESEIGLAAIYASCEKYCSPSNLIPDSESTSKAKPTIPSATLSQNMVVDETILPAASQNITAYAPNTEPFQGTELCEVTGVTRVEETPEKKQNQYNHQLHGFKPINPLATQCNVAHTVSSLLSSAENAQGKSKQKGAGEGPSSISSKAFTPKTNGGMKSFLQKQSPQKQKSYAQNSPQKQSTLTTFFQPINKKRPLEDEFSGVMSEPKRPVLESSMNMQAPDSLVTAKEIYPVSYRVPAAALQTALGSDDDLFTGPIEAHRVPRTDQEESRSRKRKEIEAEIQMEELESIMSEDMDYFDEPPLGSQAPQTQQIMQSSVKQKQSLNTVAVSSLNKRQRVDRESGSNQRPQVGLEENSDSYKGQAQKSEHHIVSTNKEQVPPSEYRTTNQEGSKPAEMLSAKTSKNRQPFEDDEASFTEDLELLKGVICQPKEETRTMIKQEAQESKINEDLPKNLLLVEFRSLTVAAPPKTKPTQMQSNDRAKNFKCFRKKRTQGAEDSFHIIADSDLLVHNRGKNTDLDEWLKDAAEEDHQSRQEETIGDDLFRYNPTKVAKRR